jgi:hypothetical protein
MTDFFVHYFVAYTFSQYNNIVYNKLVKIKLQPTDKQAQFNDVVKEIAEKSILKDYYNDAMLITYEQFYRRNTTILSLTEL